MVLARVRHDTRVGRDGKQQPPKVRHICRGDDADALPALFAREQIFVGGGGGHCSRDWLGSQLDKTRPRQTK